MLFIVDKYLTQFRFIGEGLMGKHIYKCTCILRALDDFYNMQYNKSKSNQTCATTNTTSITIKW